MPTLEAGTCYPANTPESNKRLGKIILNMRVEAEVDSRRIQQERKIAENVIYELRFQRDLRAYIHNQTQTNPS